MVDAGAKERIYAIFSLLKRKPEKYRAAASLSFCRTLLTDMQYWIENEVLRVGVNSSGAELTSLFDKRDGIEHLWQGDSRWWKRQAPILFPIVGEAEDGELRYNGKRYVISRHGFARDMEWELREQEEDRLLLGVHYTPETLKAYPFRFRLLVEYRLEENRLRQTFTVLNEDEQPIYFAIGAHPAFRLPFRQDESFSDYYLHFEKEEKEERSLLNEKGLFSGEKELLLDHTHELPLNHQLFEQDALVLKTLDSDWVSIRSRHHAKELRLSFRHWPFLGIWTKPGAPFLCLEPWQGVAETEGEKADISEKEGITKLAPEGEWERSLVIHLEHPLV